MTLSGQSWIRQGKLAAVAGLLLGALAAGCNRDQGPEEDLEVVVEPPPAPAAPVDPRLKQSFADATRAEPLADWTPIDKTLTGKSVGKLYEQVKASWDETRLATESGKRLAVSATLETDLGNIEVALRPDLAPNHVRNFMALARAGYYDGLVFERVIREVSETNPAEKLEMIEGGCPLGTGETGSGSIGYWLKPEFADVAHDEGTLGAIHEIEADTAACRFYITLCPAPLLKGNFTAFGKVTQGLDVARTIFTQPTREEAGVSSGIYRPEKPVVIKKVTIHTTEVESPVLAENK